MSETRKGKSSPAYGNKWWNDGNGNIKFSKECPEEGWISGRGKNQKKTNSIKDTP